MSKPQRRNAGEPSAVASRRSERVVLIGPMKAGKTTVGRLVAERLVLPFVSLDELERDYVMAAGFDEQRAAFIREREGDWAWYGYRRRFFMAAVERFLAEHTTGVLELGRGHPIVPDAEDQARIVRALEAARPVVLLLPARDRAECLRVLRARQRPEHLAQGDWNEDFLADDRYERLATHVVLTEGRSAETVAEVVVAVVRGGGAGS